jgi:hypothetical protein
VRRSGLGRVSRGKRFSEEKSKRFIRTCNENVAFANLPAREKHEEAEPPTTLSYSSISSKKRLAMRRFHLVCPPTSQFDAEPNIATFLAAVCVAPTAARLTTVLGAFGEPRSFRVLLPCACSTTAVLVRASSAPAASTVPGRAPWGHGPHVSEGLLAAQRQVHVLLVGALRRARHAPPHARLDAWVGTQRLKHPQKVSHATASSGGARARRLPPYISTPYISTLSRSARTWRQLSAHSPCTSAPRRLRSSHPRHLSLLRASAAGRWNGRSSPPTRAFGLLPSPLAGICTRFRTIGWSPTSSPTGRMA